jgi:hypothetical protein
MYGGLRGAYGGHGSAHGEVASQLSVITATQFWVLYTLKDSKTKPLTRNTVSSGRAVEVLAWRGTDVRRLQDVVADLDCLPSEVPHQLPGRFHGGIRFSSTNYYLTTGTTRTARAFPRRFPPPCAAY